MEYYIGSSLMIEWTQQHGGGLEELGPSIHSELVFQYMCADDDTEARSTGTRPRSLLRDGSSTTTIPNTAAGANDTKYGMHESFQYYQNCKARERNRGLFVADQNMNGRNKATCSLTPDPDHPRSNAGGQRCS